uniref:hypothetical protein n=1 Tax=uncultured Acetatifactor sp. TaxID=1671927 RepID=UPI002636B077
VLLAYQGIAYHKGNLRQDDSGTDLGLTVGRLIIACSINNFVVSAKLGISHNHDEVSLFCLVYVFFIPCDIKRDIVFFTI